MSNETQNLLTSWIPSANYDDDDDDDYDETEIFRTVIFT